MGRLAAILAAAALTVGAVVGIASLRHAPALVAVGRGAYGYRSLLDVHPAERRGVVWLGDSTIIGPAPTYAERVGEELLAPAGIGSDVRAWVGVGFQDYYCVLDRVAAAHPAVVVLVANLRVFGGSAGPFADLCSGLPLAELGRASALPWHASGLSLPRLVVLRALRWGPVETGLYWFAGLRESVRSTSWAARMGAPAASAQALERIAEKYDDVVVSTMAAYDAPLRLRRPMLAFAASAVRLAVARGMRVVVVVSPVPVEALRARGWYDEMPWRHRIDVLRRTVEDAGGRLVDLHALVRDDDFSDLLGHLGGAGSRTVAERLGPIVRALVDDAAPPSLP